MYIKPLAKMGNVVLKEVQDETLVYDLSKNKAFCLNQTSARIWHFCDGKRSISDIAMELTKEMGSAVDEDFVKLALNELHRNGLMESDPGFNGELDGKSRRTLLRKVAMGSLVALPLIHSIIAPPAAAAQSCVEFCGVCNAPSDCCDGDNCIAQFPDVPGVLVCCAAGVTGGSSATAEKPGSLMQGGSGYPLNDFCIGDAGACAAFGPTNCCSGNPATAEFNGGTCTGTQWACRC